LATAKKISLIATLAILSATAFAQRSSELSADLPDTRVMAVQDKVDSLFEDAKFNRAFFIYRNELAPIGDKHAQYMVGYMYDHAMGVDEDIIEASAWYRLSAERGTPEFVRVSDKLMRSFTDAERNRSNRKYNELRENYCDLAVLLSSIKRDMNELEERTGTRSGSDYDGSLRSELRIRLALLKEIGGFDDLDTDLDRVNLHDLERRVQQRIDSGTE
jgi:hypothetical protein